MGLKYSESIAKTVLIDPASLYAANRLCILSARATPSMVSWLFTTYKEQGLNNVSVELVVGSTIYESIDENSHKGFKELHGNRNFEGDVRFSCSYLYEGSVPEQNLYIWFQGDVPVQAFSYPYEFTQASFLRSDTSSLAAWPAEDACRLYREAVSHSIYCNHAEIEEHIQIHSGESPFSSASRASDNWVHLSLLTNSGEMGSRSGLNWGQREGRNKNEAYIRVPREIARSGFFPGNKQHFLVITDDGHTLQLRVEQQNDKAITTPVSNAHLGEYFRNRLGLKNGAYIRADDLKAYGRTDVSFYKIDEEQYYMDFSSQKAR